MAKSIPPLKSLQAFEAAARLSSFLEAAHELSVTPGAISRHIKILEQYLGAILFKRHSNGVKLTSSGASYARKVVTIFEDLDSATKAIKYSAPRNNLTVSSLPVFAERWLSERLTSFQMAFPNTDLQIDTHVDAELFSRPKVDAWIPFSDGDHPGFEVHHLFDEFLVPVCSPSFRKTFPDSPSVDEIVNSTLLHDVNWGNDWSHWAQAVGTEGQRRDAGLKFSLYSGVIQAALDDLGVAIGHVSMIQKELAIGQLVEFSEYRIKSPKAFYLAIPRPKTAMKKSRSLVAWFERECKR